MADTIVSKNIKDTEKAARGLLNKLRPHMSRATVVALEGELGAGKTTFAKAFAEGLGIHEREVASPTFVIIKNYDLAGRGHFRKFVHIDAYRLEKAEEIEKLGWKELISDPKHLVLIEWPENISGALPKDAIKISFKFIDENTREIVFN